MGFVYEEGVKYNRPGIYRTSKNGDTGNIIASALDGYGAIPIVASWGPLGVVTTHSGIYSDDSITATYGSDGTVDVAKAFMKGGLNTLHIVRLGTGGTAGKTTLKSGENDAVELTLRYPGTKAFTVSVRDKLGTTDTREIVIFDGAKAVETIPFAVATDEVSALVTAVTSYDSEYFTAVAKDGVTGKITAVSQQVFTGGANPTVTNESYTAGFEALEPYYYNVIVLDTVDATVQALLQEYLNSAAKEGNLGTAVIGEVGTNPLRTRMANAADKNDATVIYLGSDFGAAGNTTVSGAKAIATQAGVIAATPSNQSIVHREIPGAVRVTERLKNSEYSQAISNGLLLLSVNSDGKVVFDSGVNTLVTPGSNQDEGWKKIKRTKVRLETYYRLDRTLDALIGQVDGTSDGIANVIQVGQEVLDTMAAEGKLVDPEFALDEDKGYGPDYGYFTITGLDVDTLERIFLDFYWKYSGDNS